MQKRIEINEKQIAALFICGFIHEIATLPLRMTVECSNDVPEYCHSESSAAD